MVSQRPTPRISLNKLAEYSTASPARRRTIVKDAKAPKEFKMLRYRKARALCRSALLNDLTNAEVLARLDEWDGGGTEWAQKDTALSGDAVLAFLGMRSGLPDFSGWEKSKGAHGLLQCGGVNISISPDLLLQQDNSTGAIHFHISKSNPLTKQSGELAASLLERHLTESVHGQGIEVMKRHCIVLDVFTQQAFTAPKATKQRWTTANACCTELLLWWESL